MVGEKHMNYDELKEIMKKVDGQNGEYVIHSEAWEKSLDMGSDEFQGPENTAHYVVYEDGGSYCVAAVISGETGWMDVSGPGKLEDVISEEICAVLQ